MTTITVTKDETGKLIGLGEKSARAYAKFRKQMLALVPGEIFTLKTWFPRNPKLHGLHFAMLAQIFDAQEQFADPEDLRMWLQVGAGHCQFVPGPTGKMVAIPLSIAFDKMDDVDFQAHHEAVKRFLRTLHCTRFLWPAIDDQAAGDAMQDILGAFGE